MGSVLFFCRIIVLSATTTQHFGEASPPGVKACLLSDPRHIDLGQRSGKNFGSAGLQHASEGVADLRRKGVLRMDGAQLTRSNPGPDHKEASHPTGRPELLRQQGAETRVKAISHETTRRAQPDPFGSAEEGPEAARPKDRHRASWHDEPKSPGKGAPQGRTPRGTWAEEGNLQGRPETPASRTEPTARKAGCTQDK